MRVGIIGAGAIAQAAATRMVAADVEEIVLSNSRGPDTLRPVVARLGGRTRAGTVSDAAYTDLVILAVPWSRIPAAAAQVTDWAGRVLIDATNPIEAPTFQAADLGGRTSSEVVASLTPGARVVKGLNHLAPDVLGADPRQFGGRRAAGPVLLQR